jgi:hypothetical protein
MSAQKMLNATWTPIREPLIVIVKKGQRFPAMRVMQTGHFLGVRSIQRLLSIDSGLPQRELKDVGRDRTLVMLCSIVVVMSIVEIQHGIGVTPGVYGYGEEAYLAVRAVFTKGILDFGQEGTC